MKTKAINNNNNNKFLVLEILTVHFFQLQDLERREEMAFNLKDCLKQFKMHRV